MKRSVGASPAARLAAGCGRRSDPDRFPRSGAWLAGGQLCFAGQFQLQGRAIALVDPLLPFQRDKVLCVERNAL